MTWRRITVAIVVAQAVLLGIELFTKYDTFGRQNALAITNIVSTVALIWLGRWVARRGQRLSFLTVAVVLGSVWLDAIGNFQHYYGRFWWWDHLTHGIGGLAVTAICIELALVWRQSRLAAVSWWSAAGAGFLAGQFFGAVYEISEYLGDFWFKTHRVGPGFDTSRDLTFNLVGGIAALLFFWLIGRNRDVARKP